MLVPDKHKYIHSHWTIRRERILNSTFFQRKCRNNGKKVMLYTYKIQSLMITGCCIKCLKVFLNKSIKKVKYILLKHCIIYPWVLLKRIGSHTKQRNLYSNKFNKEKIMKHFCREREELITPRSDTNFHSRSTRPSTVGQLDNQTTFTTTSTNVKYLSQGHVMVEQSDEAV